ncbi:MAG: DegT/DnrJ/EryC1/StrS family aminotransferase [Bacteroidetes bacterium]|nr:DegT/DnrJ/EryC1/StrS family aminotransferase [Bacteroidota bacterium]
MNVSFVDLKQQYLHIKKEIDAAIASVIDKMALIGGSNNSFVTQFENEFAAYLGIKHVMSCANGTDSLEILLKAFGIGPGDEVIVPALSWISTSESVSNIGATPVFVDVTDHNLLLDPELIEAEITPRTKAIIPVHLYGCMAPMNDIMALAKKHKLYVIEDCAQAHGATYHGKKAGTIGHAASFSFYPGKNLGAFGDAGCMATNDDHIAEKARMIANHGQAGKHNHRMEGRNSRLDGIQAAILSVKLKYLDEGNRQRKQLAKLYHDLLLPATNIQLLSVPENTEHVYHLYVVRFKERKSVQEHLQTRGIQTAIHYPTALPYLEAYQALKRKEYPIAKKACAEILSLPMYPGLSEEEVRYTCTAIHEILK